MPPTMKLTAICLVALSVTGCMSANERAQQQLAAEASADAACNARFPGRENAVAWMKCADEARLEMMGPANPNRDLFRLIAAKNVLIAQKYQDGLISADERKAEMAEVYVAVKDEGMRREAPYVQAQATVAAAQSVSTAMVLSSALRANNYGYRRVGLVSSCQYGRC